MDVERFLPRTWPGLVALIAVALFFGGAVTFFATERADAPPGSSSVDVGFLQDMSTHHDQALALSATELANGDASGAKIFAHEIIQQQSYELGLMARQLDAWGYSRHQRPDTAMAWMGAPTPADEMPGMASPAELDALQDAAGDHADALFLALMIDHHRGGVHMASAAADSAKDPWVQEIAERMARTQGKELNEMRAAQQRLDLTDEPAGYTPGPFHHR
jgi:uncharacterized protein (DUF305 family)